MTDYAPCGTPWTTYSVQMLMRHDGAGLPVEVIGMPVRVEGEMEPQVPVTRTEANEDGDEGPLVGHFLPRYFAEPIFPVKEILEDNEVWVALRANGPGGAALADDLEILARPLPAQAITKTDPPRQ